MEYTCTTGIGLGIACNTLRMLAHALVQTFIPMLHITNALKVLTQFNNTEILVTENTFTD
jgi:hypothetical protein